MSLLPDFPSSPTNGQVATVGDYSYTYNSTTDSWEGVLGGSSGSGTFAQVFTSSGTFTVPTGVTAVKVTVIGGGGGGAGGNQQPCGGGGGGGVAVRWVTGLTPGATETVTVGGGGTGGVGGAGGVGVAGTGGGTSSFGTHASATGGSGAPAGTFNTPNVGGAGGSGSSGNINITGGNGGKSSNYSAAGGGGGSSGQSGSTHDPGLDATVASDLSTQRIYPGGTGYLGGRGGDGGFASQAAPLATTVVGESGTGFGNGGSGAAMGTTGSQNGGAGSAGIVLVEWSASVLVVNTTTGGGIGYDQSWTDVSGSRTFGVTYTNSTAKPIQILVGASTTGAGGGVALTINGVALPGSFAYSPSVTVFSATAIVPVGATYAASAYGGASYASWHELR
jgi:hypothetical protein